MTDYDKTAQEILDLIVPVLSPEGRALAKRFIINKLETANAEGALEAIKNIRKTVEADQ